MIGLLSSNSCYCEEHRRRGYPFIWALSLLSILLLGRFAIADDSRPLSIQIDETDKHQYNVYIKVPQTAKLPMDAWLSTEIACQSSAVRQQQATDGSLLKDYRLSCSQALQGSELNVKFNSGSAPLYTLIKFTNSEQQRFAKLLEPSELSWNVPTETTTKQVIIEYSMFGVTHMLTGYDHLLFVTCLLFICFRHTRPQWRSLLLTITGFTVGHSITLGMSAMQWVSINIQAVEIVIALSIAFLAAEIIRFNGAQHPTMTITYRYPAMVSTGFGLLHGFGFASLLNDFGLPYNQTLLGLVSFNIGIELGQIVFVVLLVLLLKASSYTMTLISKNKESNSKTINNEAELLQNNSYVVQLAVYSIGSIAMFWALQRLLPF